MSAATSSEAMLGKLREEFRAPLRHQRRQFGIVIGEIEERRRSGELLTLEEHRRARARAAAAR